MRILIDDEPSKLEQETVGGAIAGAAAIAREQGRLIVEVVVDGQKWTSEQLDAQELVSSGADEIRMVTAKPRELAASVFTDSSEALDSAEEMHSRAAELLQSGQTVEGLQEFGEALSLWLSVQNAVEQAAELAGIDLETAEVGGETADEILAKVKTRLEVLRSQVKDQDLLGVADTLLYDLPSVLQEWRGLLAHLGEEVRDT